VVARGAQGSRFEPSGARLRGPTPRKPFVEGERVFRGGHDQNEEEERKSWNDVGVKLVQGFPQQMAKGNQDQHSSEHEKGSPPPVGGRAP
jgi:hypothetical protein